MDGNSQPKAPVDAPVTFLRLLSWLSRLSDSLVESRCSSGETNAPISSTFKTKRKHPSGELVSLTVPAACRVDRQPAPVAGRSSPTLGRRLSKCLRGHGRSEQMLIGAASNRLEAADDWLGEIIYCTPSERSPIVCEPKLSPNFTYCDIPCSTLHSKSTAPRAAGRGQQRDALGQLHQNVSFLHSRMVRCASVRCSTSLQRS